MLAMGFRKDESARSDRGVEHLRSFCKENGRSRLTVGRKKYSRIACNDGGARRERIFSGSDSTHKLKLLSLLSNGPSSEIPSRPQRRQSRLLHSRTLTLICQQPYVVKQQVLE